METTRPESDDLVSIVVITFNSARTIAQTLESLHAQDHSAIELIVCDDASRDDTVAIARAWLAAHSERFHRTEVLTTDSNLGVRGNVGRGYAVAIGRWVKTIAGDDLLFPDALTRCIETAWRTASGFVVGRVAAFDDAASDPFAANGQLLPADADLALFELPPERLRAALARRNFIPAPGVFLDLHMLRDTGLDEEFTHLEDWPLWMNLLARGRRPVFVRDPVTAYRVHAGSISARRSATSIDPRYLRDLALFYRKYQARSLPAFVRLDRRIELLRWRLAAGPLRRWPRTYKATAVLHAGSPLRWLPLLRLVRRRPGPSR